MKLTPGQAKQLNRKAQIAALTAQGLTNRQIAERLKVTERTIYRDAKQIAPSLDHSQEIMGALRRSLQTEVTPEFRVGAMRKSIEKVDTNPFAALRAVEMANYLDGIDLILSPKQEKQSIQDNSRPLFSIGDGAQVTLTLVSQSGSVPDATQQQGVIDITPTDAVSCKE